MNNTIFILFVLALLVYMVVRQFTKQQVNMRNLLFLPALSAYASYTDLVPAFAHFASSLMYTGLAIGIVFGLLTGVFRGWHTQVYRDSSNGLIYSKPELASSLMWLALLIARVAVLVLSYSPLGSTPVVGVLIAFASSVFLVSICTQKYMVYAEYNRYQVGIPA